MDREYLVSVFNEQVALFINDLILVYPDDTDLYQFRTTMRMLLLIDDTKIIKIFNTYVYDKYKDKIEVRDSDFFLQNDFSDLMNLREGGESTITAQLIQKVKRYWSTMSEANQEIVWKYFLILIKLCEKYKNP